MLSIKEEVAKNLLYFRKRSNLTQKELASKIGVKHNSISSWEKGINSIDIEVLFNICKALDVSINDMYGQYGCKNTDLMTEREQEHIKKYRSLNENGKSKIDDYMKFILSDSANVRFEPDIKSIQENAEVFSSVMKNQTTPINSNTNK